MLERMDEFFAARLDGYDAHMLHDIEGLQDAYAEVARLVPENARALLDLGCGTGLELEEIFKLYPDIGVTGIDLTQAMLDKLRVYRYIRKQRISETFHEHRTEYYDETAEALIIKHFKANSENETYRERISETYRERFTDTSNDTVVTVLKHELDAKNAQLEVKDKQIEELNARLADVTAALISAQDTARAAQALHAGTIQAQLGDGRRGGGLWARFWRRGDGQE
jgi:SAM-dependent methyltransferase